MTHHDSIIATVSDYYTDTVTKHGATPRGVDWNSVESQTVRFDQLCRVLDGAPAGASVLDYGSGWGALLSFLNDQGREVSYTGYDIVPEMLSHARSLFPNQGQWISSIPSDSLFDYVVASGVFNVRQSHSDAEWRQYIETTLAQFNGLSRKGFAFNLLTSYSDAEKMRDYLFYADPCSLFDFCKRSFSSRVALLHDYPLYEFTILVRKLEGS